MKLKMLLKILFGIDKISNYIKTKFNEEESKEFKTISKNIFPKIKEKNIKIILKLKLNNKKFLSCLKNSNIAIIHFFQKWKFYYKKD